MACLGPEDGLPDQPGSRCRVDRLVKARVEAARRVVRRVDHLKLREPLVGGVDVVRVDDGKADAEHHAQRREQRKRCQDRAHAA